MGQVVTGQEGGARQSELLLLDHRTLVRQVLGHQVLQVSRRTGFRFRGGQDVCDGLLLLVGTTDRGAQDQATTGGPSPSPPVQRSSVWTSLTSRVIIYNPLLKRKMPVLPHLTSRGRHTRLSLPLGFIRFFTFSFFFLRCNILLGKKKDICVIIFQYLRLLSRAAATCSLFFFFVALFSAGLFLFADLPAGFSAGVASSATSTSGGSEK